MYKASIENIGTTKHYATANEYSFVLDTAGHGASPVNALLASLCGCIGHYVRDYLREQQIDYRAFTVDAEAPSDQTKLSEISLWIELNGVELSEARRSAMFAYVERCKIHKTLKDACVINLFWGRPT